jgi:hypothetical protein
MVTFLAGMIAGMVLEFAGEKMDGQKITNHFLESAQGLMVTLAFYRALLGEEIGNVLNCHYDGVQEGFGGRPDTMQFTDNITGSTTYGNSLDEVRVKLEKMREAFGK